MTDDHAGDIRVLHVEDDPAFADLASTMLDREHPAISVESVGSADAGLEVLAEGEIDCVVSDFDMPETDGLEFLDLVRERHGDIPFVLFTGKGSEEIASEAISAGVTDYIQKGSGREGYTMLANRIENAVERHRTEAALREERRRFELIGRASADAFWDWDLRTGKVERSEGYERIFGFDEEEIGDDLEWWLQQVHPDHRERVRRATMDAVEGDDDTLEVDYRVRAGDGTYKDAFARAHVVRDEAGEAVRVVGSVTDVSDLKRRERELDRVRSRLELVLEGTETGVWEWDPETGEVVWDRTVERLFGVEPGGFEGTYDAFIDRVHDDDLERVEAAIERSLESGERYDVEFRIRRDGGIRWLRAKGVPPGSGDEQVDRFVGLITDVTGRKDRERELEQYETIMETLPDGVFLLDEDGVIEGGNEAASTMLGFEREELVDTPFLDLVEAGIVSSSVMDRYGEAVRTLLSSETDDRQAEFEYDVNIDGEERVFETRLALRPHDEEFRGTIGIVQDVTRRKEREERLRRSERRFEAVFDDPSAFIGLLEPDGTMIIANETALSFAGVELDDVAGRYFLETPWWDDESPEKLDEMATSIERAAAGEFVRYDATHTGVDGETISVEGNVRPVTDGAGSVVSLLVEGWDVTDRLEHERMIERLHETTRELVLAEDAGGVAEVVVAAATEILDFPSTVVRFREGDELVPAAVSEDTEQLVGDRPAYALGEGMPGRALETGEPQLVQGLEEVDAENYPETYRSSLYLPIGEYGTLSIGSADPDAFDESDVALAKVLVNNAAVVMDRLEGEQMLRRRERALTRQNERLDRFAKIVSHDLRNPLNVAQGGVDLVEEDCESEHVGMVRSALVRMDDIIDDALSLARQGETVVDPDPVPFDRAVAAAWETIDAADATLDVGDGLGVSRADESRLQQLLENLFRNAVEHGSAGSRRDADGDGKDDGSGVTVSVGCMGDGRNPAGFYVEDDGPGIPEADREDVFEFGWSRGDGGTGFGLAIVEEIADAHGWTIAATESESGGARFEVTGVEPAGDQPPDASAGAGEESDASAVE